MSRRGSVLEGIEFKGMDFESHFEALRMAKQDRQFKEQQQEKKKTNSDTDANKIIGDVKLDHIGDNTIDLMTDKQLQGLQNKLMDMHLNGASNKDIQLYAKRELPKISNGHTVAKNKYEQIKSGLTELGKDYKSADLTKARELAVRPMIEDVVEFDDKGNAIGYKDASLIPEKNYLEGLMNDDNIGQWYKPSGVFTEEIKKLPLTPIAGGSVKRDARGKLVDQTYTGHASIFDQPVVDKETGKLTGQELKFEEVSLGKNEDGTITTVRAMPIEQFNLALPSNESKIEFRLKFNDEMRRQGIDPKGLDPRAKDLLQRKYMYDLFKSTNIHGSSFLQKDIEKQPLPPRVNVNVGKGGGDNAAQIRDVYNELQNKQVEGEKIFGSGYKGIPLNELSPTAQGIVIEYANKLTNDDLTQSDIFVKKDSGGKFNIVKSPSGEIIAPMDFTDINIKAQPGVKEKREVVEIGKSQSKTFNVVDPSTGKVVLSGVDKTAADKAKAKGYKKQ